MNRRIRISIIGTVGLPAKYGGFETMVENIVSSLSEEYDCTVYCSKNKYSQRVHTYKGVRLKYIPFDANGFQSIIYDIISLIDAVKYSERVLILGVSGCIILPFIRVLYPRVRFVTNIDGLEWKRAKWSILAKWFLKLSEGFAVNYSQVVVCDNQLILDYVRDAYGKPSSLIAYGGDHVLEYSSNQNEEGKSSGIEPRTYYFFVARIEPENNIHIILEGYSESKTTKRLVGIGNWKNSIYGQSLLKKYQTDDNIFLLDAVYDQKILNEWRANCYAYIHGHSSGGTNPSLVEAMFLGLPIIAYDVGFNRATTQNKALYFAGVQKLATMISNLDEYSLDEIGKKMLDIAKEEYKWAKIAELYKSVLK